MATTPITTDKFDSVVTSSAKPVLVDFWASWCGPCRALGPVVEEISGELSDKLDVYKCNVDEEADLATRFRIVSIPTLILFKNGKPRPHHGGQHAQGRAQEGAQRPTCKVGAGCVARCRLAGRHMA